MPFCLRMGEKKVLLIQNLDMGKELKLYNVLIPQQFNKENSK